MSNDRSTSNVTAIEVDMRNVLWAKRTTLTAVSTEPAPDYSSLVSGISVRSINEIDHLIDGLQGLREKLNIDGDRLYRAITQHATFSQSVVELTKIVSDGNDIRKQIKRHLKAGHSTQEKVGTLK